MDVNISIKPLPQKFSDPVYTVLLEIIVNGTKFEGEVVYIHDRHVGKYDFGTLSEVIKQLSRVHQNTIKKEISTAVFDVIKRSN